MQNHQLKKKITQGKHEVRSKAPQKLHQRHKEKSRN